MQKICNVKHFGFVRQDIQRVGTLECVSGNTPCRNLCFPHQIFMSLYWALNRDEI